MTPKDWVDIVKTVAEILGILVATSLAVLRWGRPSWPGILIRNILFIPPGAQAKLTSNDMTIVVDAILINPGPVSEVLTDLRLRLTDPKGIAYTYSPYAYVEPDAILEKDKMPEWVKELFHGEHILGADETAKRTQIAKCILFFPDLGVPIFQPLAGTYTVEFIISRLSVFPFRREKTETSYLEMTDSMQQSLTPGAKPEKVAALSYHLLKKRPQRTN
jgi:hypothetical protein